jgi:hypothetical protein
VSATLNLEMENEDVFGVSYYYFPHKKVMRYINASLETRRVVKIGSFLLVMMAVIMFVIGNVTFNTFHTISYVTYAFTIIIPIFVGFLGSAGFACADRISVLLEKLEKGKMASFVIFMTCTGMVAALAFLIGCYACVPLIGMLVVGGLILCVVWYLQMYSRSSDYKMIGQNGHDVVDVASLGVKQNEVAFNALSSYKEPEDPVFSISDEQDHSNNTDTVIPIIQPDKTEQPAGVIS